RIRLLAPFRFSGSPQRQRRKLPSRTLRAPKNLPGDCVLQPPAIQNILDALPYTLDRMAGFVPGLLGIIASGIPSFLYVVAGGVPGLAKILRAVLEVVFHVISTAEPGLAEGVGAVDERVAQRFCPKIEGAFGR